MDTKTINTAQDALAVLREWVDVTHNGREGSIGRAIYEWAADYFEQDQDATAQDVLRHLEMIDCAGCHAPQGLIYNKDIADKVPLWWDEIDEAMAQYFEDVGEAPAPIRGPITVGWLVWFAVEWIGRDAAAFLSHKMEG